MFGPESIASSPAESDNEDVRLCVWAGGGRGERGAGLGELRVEEMSMLPPPMTAGVRRAARREETTSEEEEEEEGECGWSGRTSEPVSCA